MGSSDDLSDADALAAAMYRELRSLARSMMAKVPPGNTLQPTALVHEAFLRLGQGSDCKWRGRGHFFGAAAQAMRQILVDQTRRKRSLKRGGDLQRVDSAEVDVPIHAPSVDMLALDEAIRTLERHDPRRAQVVLLRYIVGMTMQEVADILSTSLRTVERDWAFARAFLAAQLSEDGLE